MWYVHLQKDLSLCPPSSPKFFLKQKYELYASIWKKINHSLFFQTCDREDFKIQSYPDVLKEKKKNCSNQSTETYMFSINSSIFIDTHTYTHCIVHLQYLKFFFKRYIFQVEKNACEECKISKPLSFSPVLFIDTVSVLFYKSKALQFGLNKVTLLTSHITCDQKIMKSQSSP